MNRTLFLVACLALGCWLSATESAQAQNRSNLATGPNFRGYYTAPRQAAYGYRTPQVRGTLSPWLDLYRQDGGTIPNYHTFVRPQLRLQSIINRNDANVQYLRSNAAFVAGELEVLSTLPSDGRVSVTGNGASFMNYSHFYPTAP